MTTDAPELLPDLGFGTVGTDRHPVVRYHLGWNCGDTFGPDSDYDGLALIIEVADATDAQAMIEAISSRADLCASGQVRALEWEEYSPGCFFVRSEFGDYAIAPSASTYHDGEIRISGLDGGFTYASSLEAAKAAAQADFERRILAALTPVPQPAGEAVPEGRWVYTSACAKFERDSVRVRAYDGSIHAGWENSQEFATAEDFYTWAKAECDRRNAYEAKCRAALFAHPPQPSVSVAEAITKAKGILSSIGVHAGGMDHSRIVTAVDHLDAALRALKGGDAND